MRLAVPQKNRKQCVWISCNPYLEVFEPFGEIEENPENDDMESTQNGIWKGCGGTQQ